MPTPLGSYNPDWAVLVEKDGSERLYFVVETKSSLFTDDLRDKEPPRSSAAKRTSRRSPCVSHRRSTSLRGQWMRCSAV